LNAKTTAPKPTQPELRLPQAHAPAPVFQLASNNSRFGFSGGNSQTWRDNSPIRQDRSQQAQTKPPPQQQTRRTRKNTVYGEEESDSDDDDNNFDSREFEGGTRLFDNKGSMSDLEDAEDIYENDDNSKIQGNINNDVEMGDDHDQGNTLFNLFSI
jgi:hypothetical protein